MISSGLEIVRAQGDYLIDRSGDYYIDLCMGYGSVSLGHNYAPIITDQMSQLTTYTSPGFIESAIYKKAKQAVEHYVNGYSLHGFYPSGANAVEIAIKIAIASQNRSKVISFKNSMHGKTLFANQLGFASYLDKQQHIIQLPFVGEQEEEVILASCEQFMSQGDIAALIIEPIQMSGGGCQASTTFYQRLEALTKQYGVLQIYDEVLTGFHRTGTAFLFESLAVNPDIVLAGKAMGAGFPVSAILHKNTLSSLDTQRSGGTYFNHPMACASVIATLKTYQQLDIHQQIEQIEHTVLTHLPKHCVSGRGALWNIDMGSTDNVQAVVEDLFKHHIIVSFYDRYIRFLPNFLVDVSLLVKACDIVKQHLGEA